MRLVGREENAMPQFHLQVDNNGGTLEELAESLCSLAQRLGIEVSTRVGKDVYMGDVILRAHPLSTPQEVLTGIRDRITRRMP
jgi:hypothetical protein